MTNIQYIDCMIEKVSVYFGQFLVVKTEEFRVRVSNLHGSVKQIKLNVKQKLLVKTMMISTWEINLTFYHRVMKDDISSFGSLFRKV